MQSFVHRQHNGVLKIKCRKEGAIAEYPPTIPVHYCILEAASFEEQGRSIRMHRSKHTNSYQCDVAQHSHQVLYYHFDYMVP